MHSSLCLRSLKIQPLIRGVNPRVTVNSEKNLASHLI